MVWSMVYGPPANHGRHGFAWFCMVKTRFSHGFHMILHVLTEKSVPFSGHVAPFFYIWSVAISTGREARINDENLILLIKHGKLELDKDLFLRDL